MCLLSGGYPLELLHQIISNQQEFDDLMPAKPPKRLSDFLRGAFWCAPDSATSLAAMRPFSNTRDAIRGFLM